jgi:hypothetical protein
MARLTLFIAKRTLTSRARWIKGLDSIRIEVDLRRQSAFLVAVWVDF